MLRFLYWAPRILGLAFAAFLCLFTFDVFGTGEPWWKQALAFLIHLTPVFLVLVLLALAWRWEWVGVGTFAALGAYYVLFMGRNQHWSAKVAIGGPLFLLATLFLAQRLAPVTRKAPEHPKGL
jgi:thiol:disulfide interchange protein